MRGRALVVLVGVAAIVAVALVGGVVFRSGSHQAAHYSKLAVAGDRDSAQTTAGLGPGLTWDSYLQAADAYPAQEVSPADVQKAEATWDSIAAMDMKGGDPNGAGKKWELVGPTQHALEPGVLSFTGAMDDTASRITALVISPDCKAKGGCKVWAGAAGGGVWRTDDATARDADWKQLNPKDLDQNSVGALVLDPTDKTGNTLYLGTGEANRCTSGCEAGVGIYRSTNGGDTWDKLPDTCVDNAIYKCVSPGTDAFLGRGIGSIVIDPRNGNHIFVGSAQAVRGLSHVIGAGTTVRQPPRANEPGLYESWDGGVHFSEVWDGTKPDQQAGVTGNVSFGINDVGLDPHNLDVVYVSAFDAGLWRRDPAGPAWNFKQVFKPQFVPPRCPTTVGGCGLNGTDRTMFALTGKGAHTRLYLVEGTQPAVNSVTNPIDQNFWRTDVADQSAADLWLRSRPTSRVCRPTRRRTRSRRTTPAGRASRPSRRRARTSPRTTSAPSSAGMTLTCTRRRECRTPCTSSARTSTASSRATRTASAAATAARTDARSTTRRPPATRTRPPTCGRSPTCRTTRRCSIRRGARTRRTSTTGARTRRTASTRISTSSGSTRPTQPRSSRDRTAGSSGRAGRSPTSRRSATHHIATAAGRFRRHRAAT